MLGTTRLVLRLIAFALFLLLCLSSAFVYWLADHVVRRRLDRSPVARAYLVLLCRLCGVRVRTQGRPTRGPFVMVANHISWLDIPVLGSLSPVIFLSKASVRHWPAIGAIAEAGNTLFIERGAGQSPVIRRQIADQLRLGRSVLIFPEGTTTLGKQVLPFHGRLLEAAQDARQCIQPVTLCYRRQGEVDLDIAPFIGDQGFGEHLLRLLRKARTDVEVIWHPPVRQQADEPADALARRLHHTVAASLASTLAPPRPTVNHPIAATH